MVNFIESNLGNGHTSTDVWNDHQSRMINSYLENKDTFRIKGISVSKMDDQFISKRFNFVISKFEIMFSKFIKESSLPSEYVILEDLMIKRKLMSSLNKRRNFSLKTDNFNDWLNFLEKSKNEKFNDSL